VAVNASGTDVYVANGDGVSVINPATNSVTATINLGSGVRTGRGGGQPTGPEAGYIYTYNEGGTVSVIKPHQRHRHRHHQ